MQKLYDEGYNTIEISNSLKIEVGKCDLLCANYHREEHSNW